MTENATDRQDQNSPDRMRRPFLLKVLIWGFVIWSLLGWLRFGRGIGDRALIFELLSPAVLGYLLFSGLVWGAGGMIMVWGLLRRASWSPVLIWIAGALFPVLYWFERLVLWKDVAARANWPFMLVLTLVWLGLAAWTGRSQRVRDFFTTSEKDY